LKSKSGVGGCDWEVRRTNEGDSRPGRAGLAAGAETLDCFHPGTTKLHRLQENCGAASVKLSPEDLRELESAASKITVQGARYPENLRKLVGR